ncbi:MAG TPA: carboxypeptidase-like regulatory domain-containing protein [Methanomassiliicoccales archaeon]|nr:carboxypeptidase-like regulatory domain-containing protein [Methanomassiliicoccales archaeon]
MSRTTRGFTAITALIVSLVVLIALSVPVSADNSSLGTLQQGSGSLTGIVKDKDNRSVNGATVILSQGSQQIGETTTGSDGSFNFAEIEGTYNLTINYTGYEIYNRSVTIVAGQTTNLGYIMLTPVPSYFWILMDIIMVVGAALIFVVVGKRVRKL